MARTSPSSFTAVHLLLLTILCSSSLLSAQSAGRDRTPPTAPTKLFVTAATEHSVSLAWGSSTDNSGKFNYVISGAGPNVTVSQAQTSHTIEGLQSGKTYTLRVYARDLSGNLSKSSNVVTVTLPGQIAAPTKPVVAVVDVGPTHVSLTWSSTDNTPTLLYTVYIDGEQVSGTHMKSGTLTCAKVMVPTYCNPIDQDTTYAITVRARDVDGNYSPMSNPVVVTTDPIDPNDQTAPSQPQNISAENTGGFHLVRWDASTDDRAAQQFIRYDIYVNGQLQTVVVGTNAAEVELYLGETSTITVIAVDTADNKSEPGTITVIS